MAMIPITTRSSIRVKPFGELRARPFDELPSTNSERDMTRPCEDFIKDKSDKF
jgi:hypothetical protein